MLEDKNKIKNNLIKDPKTKQKKSNIKEWELNVKQKTKGVNNTYWFKGEIEKKQKPNISQKNSKQKPKIKRKMIKFEIKTK
jgi:hypothetical protein